MKGGRKFKSIRAPKKGIMQRKKASTLLKSRKEYSQAPSEMMTDQMSMKEQKQRAKQEQEEPQGEKQYKLEIMDEKRVAQQILTDGYINSYIDFFYIVNDQLPFLIEPGQKYLEHLENKDKNYIQLKYEIKDDKKLYDLRDKLIAAEENNRFNDKQSAIQGYHELAGLFFQTYKNYQASAYFYQRCITIAQQDQDFHWESLSTVGMGQCYYQLQRPNEAISCFELALVTVEQNHMESDIVNISEKLVEIYINMAMEQEAAGTEEDLQKALQNYQKCFEVAKKANQKEKEAETCQKLGDINFKLQNYEESAQYQQTYLQMCEELFPKDQFPEKEMKGHGGLSKCYMKLGQTDKALTHLNKYLVLAKNNQNYQMQADASFNLAQLYQKQGNQSEALTHYKQYFTNARLKGGQNLTKNMSQIDKARVLLGVTQAKTKMSEYIEMVKNSEHDIMPLLDWKLYKNKDR